MTTIDLNSELAVKRWSRDAYREYVRQSGFKNFMGKNQNSVIHLRSQSKNETGDTINIPLLAKLKGEPKRGSQPIEGNEKGMANFNFRVMIDWVGEGVAVSNSDRILFGDSTDNFSPTFSTALARVDTPMTKAIVQNARMIARTARRIIRPATVEERTGMSGKGGNIVECFVMFVGAKTFMNLKQDAELREDLRYAMDRGKNNPIFRPDDLMIDNVIIREIPEITERCIIGGAGADGRDVEPYYLCGAQAIAYAIGKEATFKTDARDYGHINGVAVRELRGIEKTVFTGPLDDSTSQIDHGMLTGYVLA